MLHTEQKWTGSCTLHLNVGTALLVEAFRDVNKTWPARGFFQN